MKAHKSQLDLDNYWTRTPFRLAVESRLLKSHPAEGEVILRVGAVANAVLAIGRAVRGLDRTLPGFRNALQCTTLIASYAKEVAKVLNKRHGGLGWTIAREGVRGGHRLTSADLSKLQDLLAESSSFLAICTQIRDEQGFHVDPAPFLRWLDSADRGETVTFHSAEGVILEDWLFDVAAQVLHDAMPLAARSEAFQNQLAHFARTLPSLTEAMIAGFVRLYCEDVSFMDGIETEEYTLTPTPTSADTIAIAIRPVGATWSRFFVGLLAEEAEDLGAQLCVTPAAGGPLQDVGVLPRESYPGWWIRLSTVPAAPTGDKLCLVCKQTPGPIIFGEIAGPRYALILSRKWRPRVGATPPPAPPTVIG